MAAPLLHQPQHNHRGAVTLAVTEVIQLRVPTRLALEAGADLLEEFQRRERVGELGHHKAAMRLRVLPAAPTTLWVRIRSGAALVVLVGVLGALLALAVGGVVVGAALLIRSATG